MILLYRIFTTCLYPFLILLIHFRKILKKEHVTRYKEKIYPTNFNVVRNKNSKLIWFHAASIGELKSIIPIIELLNKNKNKLEFLITTTTLSSGNLAKIELKHLNNAYHRFIPFDVEFLIKKFLFLWKPDAIFLVDSEIWPNLILNASKYKIPLAVINARLTSKSFNKWIKFPRAAKKIFSLFDLCLASNLETKKYLEELGAKNIYFNGNIKLINKLDENKIKNLSEKILLKNRFWIAASTHKGEDILCLKTHLKLKEKYKDIITIIAPRHIERSYNIKSLSEALNLKAQILNKNDVINEDKEIIIINTFGVLQNFFKYAKSVFIGKSTIKKLENDGGQNPIDAAKLKCKIYHGPFVYNFKEIYEILEKGNIAKQIESYEELSNYLVEDLKSIQKQDDQIANTINDLGQKTLTDTMKYINNFLFNEIK